MAGAKGRSGGARPGAGRPPKETAVNAYSDPLDFLQAVWTGQTEATVAQVRAATAALPFKHKKLGEGKGSGEKPGVPQAGSRYATRTGPRATH